MGQIVMSKLKIHARFTLSEQENALEYEVLRQLPYEYTEYRRADGRGTKRTARSRMVYPKER